MLKRLNRIFGIGHRRKVRSAFKAVKTDMQAMEEEHFALKNSADEWVRFLDQNNRELALRVYELEKRLAMLEGGVDEEQLSILREI